MTSYRTGISGNRRAASRFVAKVHRQIQKAYEGRRSEGVTQTSIANAIGVHRSVINRQLNGREDISVGRVGEFAWALGFEPEFSMTSVGGAVKQGNLTKPVIPAATTTGGAIVATSSNGKTWNSAAFIMSTPENV